MIFDFSVKLLASSFILVAISSCTVEDVMLGCPTFSDSAFTFHDGFEGGAIDEARWNLASLDPDRPDAVQVINDVNQARKGSHAAKFTVYPGDLAAEGNRAEILLRSNDDHVCTEVYYAWSFKVDSNYQPVPEFQTVGSFHAKPDLEAGEVIGNYNNKGAPAPIYFQYGRRGTTNLEMVIDKVSETNSSNNYIFVKDIGKGEWVDIIVHIRWSLWGDGFVEGWANGQRFTPYNPQTNDYKVYGQNLVNKAANSFKIGLYRGDTVKNPANTIGVVWYDEIFKGNALAEVILH